MRIRSLSSCCDSINGGFNLLHVSLAQYSGIGKRYLPVKCEAGKTFEGIAGRSSTHVEGGVQAI